MDPMIKYSTAVGPCGAMQGLHEDFSYAVHQKVFPWFSLSQVSSPHF